VDLFLLADDVEAADGLVALAQGKWAAVIDLNPESDVNGLSSILLEQLEKVRHVSVYGSNGQSVKPVNATNWLMANGWSSHGEATTTSDEAWRRRKYFQRVRDLIEETHRGTPNQLAAVLCLRSGHRSRQIDRIVEYIEEVYDGINTQVNLVSGAAGHGFDSDAFLSVIAESLPQTGGLERISLPGTDGQRWQLTPADLNRLAVDLDVLHSHVLTRDRFTTAPPTEEFWRGRPPTWAELEAWVDVERDACADLMAEIKQRLTDPQLYTVHLDHSPGAGGTTLARRIAWNLHRTFPTVVLHTYTDTTVDRIDEIYQQSGKPVFMVAESTVLPEPDREVLRRDLAERNSRAVLLWVNRTNHDRGSKHQLIDPLGGSERERFLAEYRRRAEAEDSERALRMLDDLAADGRIVPASKLSPFYFGLCVYDHKFEGVKPYVRHHLAELTDAQREVARFLALVTRYGQDLGLPLHMVRAWLGAEQPAPDFYKEDDLRELLGPDLRHLVLADNGQLRLLHPLIAERVLKGEEGSEQLALGRISREFIRKVSEYLGAENSSTWHLLSELFIRRTTLAARQPQSEHFSELVLNLTTEAGKSVFQELTTCCPKNPHFWNHRGRYHIYKVRGSFEEAERYLLRAVESTKGGDSTHLHTLGMVRRFWVESDLARCRQAARQKGVDATPEMLLEAAIPNFDRAMDAFKKAAGKQVNEHNWATPIQLIATVIDALLKASGKNSLADLLEEDGDVSRWATQQIELAERHLENLREIKPEGKYYEKLSKTLDTLYGDVERLVERWKQLREITGTPEIELAVARTLYAGVGRDWGRLREDDLRTIAEMTEGAVHNGQATDADVRLWFQAYRRLPEYSETAAMEQLSWFASNKRSLEATYYLYVLHFLIWYRGDARDQERVRFHLEECSRLSRQERRQWSYEWLGVDTRQHPLVHYSELGVQRREPTNFWSHPHELRRVSGVIEEIKSPQAGRVRVFGDKNSDGNLTAFFTPRNAFLRTRDINKAIDFYLGFSYEGLRAWEPTYPGGVPAALEFADPPRRIRAAEGPVPDPPEGVVEERDADEATESVPPAPVRIAQRPKIDPALVRALQQRKSAGTDITELIMGLLRKSESRGERVSLIELGSALGTILGYHAYKQFKDGHGGKLRPAVAALGFKIRPDERGDLFVELP
jgi:tetratricopeptide (TPR) repeat protein